MSETLLLAGGILIIIFGVRLLNRDTGGTLGGAALIIAGLGALVRAYGYDWTNTAQWVRWLAK